MTFVTIFAVVCPAVIVDIIDTTILVVAALISSTIDNDFIAVAYVRRRREGIVISGIRVIRMFQCVVNVVR